MAKVKQNHRLEPEIFERLKRLQESQGITFEEVISSALDALEREINLPESLLERVENLEDLIGLIIKKLEILDAKVASFEKIRSLFQIMEKQLVAHDEAELARFKRIAGPHIFD